MLGSSIICESVGNRKSKPTNAIVDWQDGDRTYYLYESTANSSALAGDEEIDRIHLGITGAAVWSIVNNAICKVHAWCEGLELEANTIRFVRQSVEEVPVPEVIHTWMDHNLSRTFLITRRVSGQILEQAWPRLSSSQRKQIADGIARYCDTLVTKTSSLFEMVTGCGVHEPRLMPTWLPRTMGPFSSEAVLTYMKRISTEPPPNIDTLFHFYHADLGPTNMIISEEGTVVTGIIDWESGAFYPRFWIATKPAVSSVYWLDSVIDERADLGCSEGGWYLLSLTWGFLC